MIDSTPDGCSPSSGESGELTPAAKGETSKGQAGHSRKQGPGDVLTHHQRGDRTVEGERPVGCARGNAYPGGDDEKDYAREDEGSGNGQRCDRRRGHPREAGGPE